jgi:hypothetical protein
MKEFKNADLVFIAEDERCWKCIVVKLLIDIA